MDRKNETVYEMVTQDQRPTEDVPKGLGGMKKQIRDQPYKSSHPFDNQIQVLLFKPEIRSTPIGPDLIE